MADNKNSSLYALKPGSNKNIPSSNPSLKATRSNRNYAGIPSNAIKPANSNQSVFVKNLQPAMCITSSALGSNVPTTGRVVLRNLATGQKHNKFVHIPPSKGGRRRLKKRSTRRR